MKLSLSSLCTPLIVLCIALPLSSCSSGDDDDNDELGDSAHASTYDSSVSVEWAREFYRRVKATGTTPPVSSRQFGATGVALYEALIAGMPDRQTLQGQLNAFSAGTIPAPSNELHHWLAVANATLAAMARGFYTDSTSTASIDALETTFNGTFTTDGVSDAILMRSAAYGQDVGQAVLAWLATDGFVAASAPTFNWCSYSAPSVDGAWVGTGLGLQPCWGTLRTFAVTNSTECLPFGAPTFSTATTSEFFSHGVTVYNVVNAADAAQRATANYWNDGATLTGTPPGHWWSITAIVLEDGALSLDVSAEAFARVGMAVADAFITCWRTKFDTYLARPVQYINSLTGTTIDVEHDWASYIGTPNFSTYTSGHSTESAAAAAVLTDMFGPISFTDHTHAEFGNVLAGGTPADRLYANFSDASNEAVVSRLYGGIHYIFDNEDGADQGACIGAIQNARLQFLK